ncbi:MAG: hypothetical protein E7157_06055 [Lactobacillales bacterium]|nr:hypothetical protein [Lactobacillales bacterium]
MNWVDKYIKKQKQKELEFIKKIKEQENNKYYKIPDEYLNHPLFADYNEVIEGKFSKEIGEELEKLFDDDDYVICIHRTGLDLEENKDQIDDIFNNGLMNAGGPYHGFTLTPLEYFPLVISQVLTSSHYRHGTCRGGVIAKIPKKDLGLKEGEPKPIWFQVNEYNYRLLPEYIYGYIPSYGDKVETIYRNENYTNVHNYQNDGLYYDREAKLEKNKTM